jgi:S1-C subfamily serine protease
MLMLGNAPGQAQDVSKAVFNKVRERCVEVQINGQLRGGGAFVRNQAGKVFVLTAAHLFASPRETCEIVAYDDETYFASLSAYDLGHDLAVLELPPETARYGALDVAKEVPTETTPVFNFGPALRRSILVLPGTIADSTVTYTDFASSRGYLAHIFVAGISPILTSGGIWVDRLGHVVGVQHGRLIGDEGAPSSGLSMVSPPEAVAALLGSNSMAKTPGLGGYVWEIQNVESAILKKFPDGVSGLLVRPLVDDQPLDKAGVKLHDLIMTCDGVKLRRRQTLLNLIRAKPPGSTFQLQILSPGASQTRTVSLTSDCLEDHWR